MDKKEQQYFFVLGSNPALSLAELEAVFGLAESRARLVNNEIAILGLGSEIEPEKLIERLGGTIKFGLIEGAVERFEPEKIIAALSLQPVPGGGKFKFGFSYYGRKNPNLKPLGMEMKKHFLENGISSRWVVSRERVLSSVVVEQNKLVKGGLEAVLIEDGKDLLLGRTLAVQPFKTLSFRDYGRPARDDQSGMIPPKLAMIMINLAQVPSRGGVPRRGGEGDRNRKERINNYKTSPLPPSLRGILLDPFCGSGTILMEAALMGFENIVGSDISSKAVEDTKKNLNWLSAKYQIPNTKYQVSQVSAAMLSRQIKASSIDAIVTEPYLGPQRGRIDFKAVVAGLNSLYSSAIAEFAKIVKPGGRVVMVWPVFRDPRGNSNSKNFRLSPQLFGLRIKPALPPYAQKFPLSGLDQPTILYGRPDQKVWREIVVLEKRQETGGKIVF